MNKVVIEKNGRYWQCQPPDEFDKWGDRDTAARLPVAKALTRVKRMQKNYQAKLKLEAVDK